MITPRFSLLQDDNYLTINIRAPYCNLKELETYVEGNDFRFVCSPYYLRLNLPGNILDNDNASGKFISDTGEFILKYQKEQKGEYFYGLDFVTSLLAVPKKSKQPQIEVLKEVNENPSNLDQQDDEWYVEQKNPEEQACITNIYKYGFANQKYNVFLNGEDEFCSIFDNKNVYTLSLTERRNLRLDTESMDFSSEHYLADYFDNEDIKDIINLKHPWTKFTSQTVKFDDSEKDILKDLPNKEYVLDLVERKYIMCGLIDILFAYCYDRRTTDFEGTCESGWTISKLSATLSWLDVFQNEKETLISSFRRSLIYPLYRNFELLLTVFEDLKMLLDLGPIFIVKCLLNIFKCSADSSEAKYLLNELYIKDYIIYMQKCPNLDLEETITKVKEIKISEEDVKLNLPQIIQDAIQSSKKDLDILYNMSQLNIHSDSSDSASDSDSEDTTSDSDDTSSSDD